LQKEEVTNNLLKRWNIAKTMKIPHIALF